MFNLHQAELEIINYLLTRLKFAKQKHKTKNFTLEDLMCVVSESTAHLFTFLLAKKPWHNLRPKMIELAL